MSNDPLGRKGGRQFSLHAVQDQDAVNNTPVCNPCAPASSVHTNCKRGLKTESVISRLQRRAWGLALKEERGQMLGDN